MRRLRELMINCNICNNELTEKVYESPASKSLTSICKSSSNPTEVYFCRTCNHVQTREFGNELAYYDTSYNILTNSEDEDQIYIANGERTIFRTDHQLETLLSKVNLVDGFKLLDYGCGKSSTTAKLLKSKKNIEVYLFDVSENYIPFWEKFLPKSNWATYKTPKNWSEQFDLITSFFSLEHISSLREVIANIKSLLKVGGIFYCVVPNFLTNIADLIVVDHPNHFTKNSLTQLFTYVGFSDVDIDENSHRGAFVIKASKNSSNIKSEKHDSKNIHSDIVRISSFWSNLSKRIADFESKYGHSDSAIYGAGFYGAFIYRNIKNKKLINNFLDQNPHLKNTSLFDIKILSPEELPENIKSVYIGLNPYNAKNIIDSVPELNSRPINLFYL
jgi:2-polyprenyl-3-methyl-5-hydroxy-6-metoxy-1,4-benzoquinol methylase